MDVKRYLFDKLIFPKTLVINKPGIIYTKQGRKFGSSNTRRRLVFHFEDIIANLQLETKKEFGKKKTEELWYKIGKDVGMRYMLISKAKIPPSFLIPSIVEYIFNGLKSGGLSLAENVDYNHKNKSLILNGRDNFICRKSGICSAAGSVSMIFSFLTGENIEAEVKCENCPEKCIVLINKNIKTKYIPNSNELKPLVDYKKLNFPDKISLFSKLPSFENLMTFNKIKVDSGKFNFLGKTILPTEAGFLGLIVEHYVKINKKYLLEKGLVEGAQNIARDIFKDNLTINDKINTLKTILGAFGWGIPNYQKKDGKIIFDFLYPPRTRYSYLYQALVINGYLNYIFDKKFEIKKINSSEKFRIRIEYASKS